MMRTIALAIALMLMACAAQDAPPASAQSSAGASLANPASVNCARQGGTLSIQRRGDGGEYGVCRLAPDKACEEWALLRGTCPAGGRTIPPAMAPAAQYCLLTGGEYTPPAPSGDAERGRCLFRNGSTCDAGAYWNGTCAPAP